MNCAANNWKVRRCRVCWEAAEQKNINRAAEYFKRQKDCQGKKNETKYFAHRLENGGSTRSFYFLL